MLPECVRLGPGLGLVEPGWQGTQMTEGRGAEMGSKLKGGFSTGVMNPWSLPLLLLLRV